MTDSLPNTFTQNVKLSVLPSLYSLSENPCDPMTDSLLNRFKQNVKLSVIPSLESLSKNPGY